MGNVCHDGLCSSAVSLMEHAADARLRYEIRRHGDAYN